MDEQKQARIAYINKSQTGDGTFYGKMVFDGETLVIRNIEHDGPEWIGDVKKQTDRTYTDRSGTVRNEFEVVGAIRWNTEKGTGDYVTTLGDMTVKYPLTNAIEEGKFGPSRVLRFKQPSTNKFRVMFDKASEVIDEEPNIDTVSDDLPF